MPQISYSEMASALRDAGFSGIQIPVMIAIAMAESGGNNDTVGDSGNSYGLWQIYQPVWGQQFDVQCAVSVKCAAKAAWEISNHGSYFKAWTVYRAAVEPETLPEELRANKFTNYLPDVLKYFDIPVDVNWASELKKINDSFVDKVNDVIDDITQLPEWAQKYADKITPAGLSKCGIPDLHFGSVQQAEWAACIIGTVTDDIGIPNPFDLIPSLGDVENAVVVVTVLGLGAVLVVVGLVALSRKSEIIRDAQDTAVKTGVTIATTAAKAAAMA